MKRLFILVAATAALLISTTASAYDSTAADGDYLAKRTQVEKMIFHAHYSSRNGGVATVLTKMADRAHAAGFTTRANSYIVHAQNAAALDLKR